MPLHFSFHVALQQTTLSFEFDLFEHLGVFQSCKISEVYEEGFKKKNHQKRETATLGFPLVICIKGETFRSILD